MELKIQEIGRDLVVDVRTERLDALAAVGFRDAMRAAVAKGHRRVFLDLHDVTFVDSSGLGAIVSVWKSMEPGRSFELCRLTPLVARVFKLTRMDEVIRVHQESGVKRAKTACVD